MPRFGTLLIQSSYELIKQLDVDKNSQAGKSSKLGLRMLAC